MRIAAILTIGGPSNSIQPAIREHAQEGSYANVELLGATLVQRTIERLDSIDVPAPTVLTDEGSTESGRFIESWEDAVSRHTNEGAELLLLARIGTYTDVDFSEVVRFHSQTRSRLTQVYCGAGSLELMLVSTSSLRNIDGSRRRALSDLIPQRKRFNYTGYVNWLRSPGDLHQLMQDGLNERCELRPKGVESKPGLWLGSCVEVDPTARIMGPAYIGPHTSIGASCTISGPTAIERNCQIDCGTTVEESLVLATTYVGVALDVRRAVVNGQKLVHLNHNVELEIADERLIRRNVRTRSLFAGLASLLGSEVEATPLSST